MSPVLTVSLDCPFVLPFRYSLTFIYNGRNNEGTINVQDKTKGELKVVIIHEARFEH